MNDDSKNNPSTIVGVLSDTHGRFFDSLYAALSDCDYIIHAGDIGNPHIIRALEGLAPVIAVRGNNDFDEYGKDVGIIAKPMIAGVRFLISHYPQDVDFNRQAKRHYESGELLPHVCIHGHTHVPKLVSGPEASPADLLLCPGSPVYPRMGSKPQIAKIELTDMRFKKAWFEEV